MSFIEKEMKEIAERLSSGEKIDIIAKEKSMSKSLIYKKLKASGFEYDKKQGLWYEKNNIFSKEMLKFMSSIDIEEEVEQLAEARYYYKEGFYYDDKETEVVVLDKNIYDELQLISDEWGADNVEELTSLIILRFLENIRPRDFSEEFEVRRLSEEGYDNREIEIIKEHGEEADELWDFYKDVLKNEIGYTDMQINSISDSYIPTHYNLSKDCKSFEENSKYIEEKYKNIEEEMELECDE